MQLKFIANIFQYSLQEIKETLGYEALTMILRRVGERVGENIVNRLEGKYASVEEFCNLLITDVIAPVVGDDKATADIRGDNVIFKLDTCPYKAAGFPIQDMSFFCEYTEGLIENALQCAFPGKNYQLEYPVDSLISKEGCKTCVFKINS